LRELTGSDLALTPAEGEAFLATVAGIELDSETSRALIRRTEGWITGLKLATVALRDAPDPVEYVRTFAGRGRDVADFLLGEVLIRQPVAGRSFLPQTSILDVLSAESRGAVTGRDDSAVQLRRLESEGIFVVALDDNRDEYR
jgi:LuxR family maltose regulon positive regulatory protein